jgi:hypothetical protein
MKKWCLDDFAVYLGTFKSSADGYKIKKILFFILKLKKYTVFRFVHFGVLCIAKYRYDENSAASSNLKQNPFHTLKVQILV